MAAVYHSEPATNGKVVINTTFGAIDIELWSKEAPRACRNFVQLCLEGYYEDTIFHRIISKFMIQGGDPTGTGKGGDSIYGEPFIDEFHSRIKFNHRGQVAMANFGENQNGSQFFVTLDKCEWLDRKHTIFGKVTGPTIFNAIKMGEVETDNDDRPLQPPKIISCEVLSNPFDDIVPRPNMRRKNKQEETKRDTAQKATKNKSLLSFEHEGEGEEVVPAAARKIVSAHDVLDDHRLSKEAVSIPGMEQSLAEKKKAAELKAKLAAASKAAASKEKEKERGGRSREAGEEAAAAAAASGASDSEGGGGEDADNFERAMRERARARAKAAASGKGEKQEKTVMKNGRKVLADSSDEDSSGGEGSGSGAGASQPRKKQQPDVKQKLAEMAKEERKRKVGQLAFKEDRLNPAEIRRADPTDYVSPLEQQRLKYKKRNATANRQLTTLEKMEAFKKQLVGGQPPAKAPRSDSGAGGSEDERPASASPQPAAPAPPPGDGVAGAGPEDDEDWKSHRLEFLHDKLADREQLEMYAVYDPRAERKQDPRKEKSWHQRRLEGEKKTDRW
eukprot:tig00020830_g14440.t1